jgi:hypothetical protein
MTYWQNFANSILVAFIPTLYCARVGTSIPGHAVVVIAALRRCPDTISTYFCAL